MSTTLVAGAAGLILGCPVGLIWLFLSRRMGRTEFWPSCLRLTRSLCDAVDVRELSDQYCQLLKLLGKYLARNVLFTGAVSLPVVLFVLLVTAAVEAGGSSPAGFGSLLNVSNGQAGSFWSLLNGLDIVFFVGLGLSSSTVNFVFARTSR